MLAVAAAPGWFSRLMSQISSVAATDNFKQAESGTLKEDFYHYI